MADSQTTATDDAPSIQVDETSFVSRLNRLLYADRRTVVDELVQNAQRAEADVVEMRIDEHGGSVRLEFEDDGVGCEPEDLLTLAETAWEDEVVGDVDPFGLGFWSITLLEGRVTVYSRDWKLEIDVPTMIESETLDVIDIERGCENNGVEGTRIVVHNPDFGDHNPWRYENAFRNTVRHAPFDEARLNGSGVATGVPRDEFSGIVPEYSRSFHFEGDGFECVLAPAEKGYDNPTLYYQDRPVGEINVRYMKGHVFADNGTIGVRAPDRKEPIHDDRFDELVEKVESAAREALAPLIRSRSDETSKLSSAILHYYEAGELADVVRFADFDDESLEGALSDDDDESADGETSGASQFSSATTTGYGSIPEETFDGAGWESDDPVDGRGVDEFDGPVWWVDVDDVERFERAVRAALDSSFDVVVASTPIERHVAENSDRMVSVSRLRQPDASELHVVQSNPTGVDERAVWVVDRAVDRLAGDGLDVEYGRIEYRVDVGGETFRFCPDDASFRAVTDEGTLVLDDSYAGAKIRRSNLAVDDESGSIGWNTGEIRFLLAIADDLADALSDLRPKHTRRGWRERINELAVTLLGGDEFDTEARDG